MSKENLMEGKKQAFGEEHVQKQITQKKGKGWRGEQRGKERREWGGSSVCGGLSITC